MQIFDPSFHSNRKLPSKLFWEASMLSHNQMWLSHHPSWACFSKISAHSNGDCSSQFNFWKIPCPYPTPRLRLKVSRYILPAADPEPTNWINSKADVELNDQQVARRWRYTNIICQNYADSLFLIFSLSCKGVYDGPRKLIKSLEIVHVMPQPYFLEFVQLS